MTSAESVLTVDTGQGPARVHRRLPESVADATGTLVLGHGAGGGVDAVDLVAAAVAAATDGWGVLRVEQPWKVAGRRVAVAPPRLDEAWLEVLGALRQTGDLVGPLVVGGRSAGARVACRTASVLGASGVLALAFPLHPPGRPERSRAAELRVGLPLLVVQGESDPFGGPDEVRAALARRRGSRLVAVPGDHGMKAGRAQVGPAVRRWLRTVASRPSPAPTTDD